MRFLAALLLSLALAFPAFADITVATIPSTTVKVGSGSFQVPRPVPDTTSGYKITINQGAWPFTGGRAATFSLEVSLDGGQTWQSIASFDVNDEVQGGGPLQPPAGTFIASATMPQGTGRLLRLSWVALKQIGISGQIDVF